MNTQQTIAEIQADANRRIAEIRAAEQALAAAMAANAKSEAQRQQEAIEAAEIAAALATWQGETWPAFQEQMTALSVDFDAHRATINRIEEMLKSIPTTHNAGALQPSCTTRPRHGWRYQTLRRRTGAGWLMS